MADNSNSIARLRNPHLLHHSQPLALPNAISVNFGNIQTQKTQLTQDRKKVHKTNVLSHGTFSAAATLSWVLLSHEGKEN